MAAPESRLRGKRAAQSLWEESGTKVREITDEERAGIISLGERFGTVWESEDCPVELKKRIFRTVIEEVIVDLDDESETLSFVIHWKGGTYTRFEMARPPSGVGRKTSLGDLEVIRRMAVRYGDDEIARVLNKLGRRTARDKRWNEHRVATARRRHSIEGRKRSSPDPEILTLGGAAKYSGVSETTIRRLVAEGVLPREQVVPWRRGRSGAPTSTPRAFGASWIGCARRGSLFSGGPFEGPGATLPANTQADKGRHHE